MSTSAIECFRVLKGVDSVLTVLIMHWIGMSIGQRESRDVSRKYSILLKHNIIMLRLGRQKVFCFNIKIDNP